MRFSVLLMILAIMSGCGSTQVKHQPATNQSSATERRNSKTTLSDQKIEKTAIQAITADAALGHSKDIQYQINAYNGIILVTGQTTDARLRNRLIDIVRVIPRVKRVYNEMTLAPRDSFSSRSNDTYLAGKVRSALKEINIPSGFNSDMVKAVVDNSVVYLMGIVYRHEGQAVAKKVQHVDGVVKIVTLFEYLD